jgi:branched-chain amino acid transport system permease protein
MTTTDTGTAAVVERFRRPLVTGAGIMGVVALWAITSAVWPNSAPLGVVLQGVVFGTVTGLMAVGLVLIYKTSNIINFAYGGMGGVAGVLAVTLFLEAGLNYFAAIAIGLVVGLALGGLVEVTVIRRFANSSRLILTVATIGLAQILGGIELFIPRAFDATGLVGGFQTPLTFSFSIHPVVFTGDHLLILACVPPIIGALLWFLLRTDMGIAVRAAADNSERALLLGIPIRRISTVVWVIAGGLAGLTFILKAPFAGSVSTALGGVATLLLPALAASMVARMENLPLAFGAGVGLGVLEQLVFWNTGRASTIDVAFLAIILIALLAQRGRMSRAFEGAGTWSMSGLVRNIPRELRHLPEVRFTRAGLIAAAVAAAVIIPMGLGPGTVNLMSVALVWGMVAISLVILTGWGGSISLGQFAIVGVGAVAAGNIAVRWNLDMFITLLIAGAAGGLIALLIGLPALRIRGLFLAATTLAFAVALDSFFLNPVNFPNYIPGGLNRPVLWERFDLQNELSMYYVCLAFLGLAILAARGVRNARGGRVLLATRDNARAAGAAGVPTTASKLSGFVLSGVIAGVAGGLYILLLRGVGAGSFQPTMSLEIFSMAVIGGLGSIFGALIGVFSFRLLRQVLTGELRLLVTGAGLLFVLFVLPGGLGEAILSIRDRFLRLVANRRGIIVPSLVADRRDTTEDRPEDETSLLSGALAAGPDHETTEVGR